MRPSKWDIALSVLNKLNISDNTPHNIAGIAYAKQAVEKQIPKKPILEYHKEPYPKNYGMMIKFLCPNCGRFIVAMYEIDVEDGRMRKDLKGCPTCLQAIDFTEYYNTDKHNGKLDEELGFKE